MDSFFYKTQYDEVKDPPQAGDGAFWLISADKIFSSGIKGFETFSRFLSMEFDIQRFSTYDGEKTQDSAVKADNVTIFIAPGRYCATLEGNLAKGTKIAAITLQKVLLHQKAVEVIEKKEFKNCILERFSRKGEVVSFAFRYSSFSDTYTEFKNDGTKLGTSATSIDLIQWKITTK